MAGFFPPPPVFVGGAQPYAPRKFVPPDATPDNPPIRGPLDAEILYAIRSTWDVPYVPQQRLPTVTASYVPDNPPLRGPLDAEIYYAIRQGWELPYVPQQRAPFVLASGVVVVPQPAPNWAQFYAIRQAWELPYVPQQRGALFTPSGGDTILFTKSRDTAVILGTWTVQWPLPQVAPKLVQTGAIPDAPPPRGPLSTVILANILQAWIPPPWDTRYTIMQPQSGPDIPPTPPAVQVGGSGGGGGGTREHYGVKRRRYTLREIESRFDAPVMPWTKVSASEKPAARVAPAIYRPRNTLPVDFGAQIADQLRAVREFQKQIRQQQEDDDELFFLTMPWLGGGSSGTH